MSVSSVALIGSFRQHYDAVRDVFCVFRKAGLTVTTPLGTEIIRHGIPFVHFQSDAQQWSDEMIQTLALHRILRADFVYVVAPEGYVGRTTCYEIGRVVQAQHPLYFSTRPKDLPVHIPATHILSADQIAGRIRHDGFVPAPVHAAETNDVASLERDLIDGEYRQL